MLKKLILILVSAVSFPVFATLSNPDRLAIMNDTQFFAHAYESGHPIGHPVSPNNYGTLTFQEIFSNCIIQDPCEIAVAIYGQQKPQTMVGMVKATLDTRHEKFTIVSVESTKPLTYHFTMPSDNVIKISEVK